MRQLEDWLVTYLDFTKEQEAPEPFHLWSGVSVLASTIGRNVWINRGFYELFPNHYIFIVAPSSLARKSVAVGIARDILEKSKTAEVMAERITNPMLLTELHRAAQKTGRSEMLCWADELALFMSKEETHKGIITTLTRLYGCPKFLENKLKTVPCDCLKDVCLNILAATTPTDIAELIPSSAIGKGFIPRVHTIYQPTARHKKLTPFRDLVLEAKLVADLQHIKKIQGPFAMTEEDTVWLEDWYKKQEKPPEESLDGFYGRKHDFVFKLSMILTLARQDELVLRRPIMETAIKFLGGIEDGMLCAYKEIGRQPNTDHVDRVIRQIERIGGKMSKSEVLRANWNKFNATEWAGISFHLQEAGLIDVIPGRPVVYVLKKGGKK